DTVPTLLITGGCSNKMLALPFFCSISIHLPFFPENLFSLECVISRQIIQIKIREKRARTSLAQKKTGTKYYF
uniref:hypothetical protein n=1 Tax=Enterocloster sp. TaxID=2719315 RepID=UPI003FEF2859